MWCAEQYLSLRSFMFKTQSQMYRRVILSLFFCLFFLLPDGELLAQEQKTEGVVFDRDTKIRLALAQIYNKRSGYGVGSNDMGGFTLATRIGDTLLVSKRGYSDQEVVVLSAKPLLIYLRPGTLLETVEIKGQNKKQALDEVRRELRNKGSFYAGKPPLLSFLFTPLTAIYELVGRTPRNARRFGRYYVTELQQSMIDLLFNKVIIQENTGLQGKSLDDFMMHYRPTYEQAEHWNTYDGLKWIKESYKKYADTAKNIDTLSRPKAVK